MKEIEKLPVYFQKNHRGECNCCDTIREETVNYELKIDVLEHSRGNNKRYRSYRIYYQPTWYCSFQESPKIIGYNTGMGETNVKKLVDDLLKLI